MNNIDCEVVVNYSKFKINYIKLIFIKKLYVMSELF